MLGINMKNMATVERGYSPDIKTHELTREIEREILLAIQGIRYGSVEIIIHNSEVVQIERKEKVRFERDLLKKRC
jgi:hypothetical protein